MSKSFAFVLGLALLMPNAASAQQTCPTRTEIVKDLDKRYRESPAGMGIINHTTIIEIFVSEKGTFTILQTTADGRSCPIAAGGNFEALKVRPAGRDS